MANLTTLHYTTTMTNLIKSMQWTKLTDHALSFDIMSYHSNITVRSIVLVMFSVKYLHEKYTYSEFFWSTFSRFWTEYGKMILLLTTYIGPK